VKLSCSDSESNGTNREYVEDESGGVVEDLSYLFSNCSQQVFYVDMDTGNNEGLFCD
jgi:hypothetical protein